MKLNNHKTEMLNKAGKSKPAAFCTPALAFCLLPFAFLSPSLSFAQDPNATNIQMLHVAIRADVNEVHFENIWVFKRQSAAQGSPWQASIDLPKAAALVGIDEPNQTEFIPSSKTIRKKMADDSLIDSVGFTFALPNKNGACQTSITPPYQTASMLVSVSGQATKFTSNLLKYDQYRTSRSRFAGVYTAANLPADTRIDIALTSLPQPDSLLAEYLSIAGFALIIVLALFTISSARVAKKT